MALMQNGQMDIKTDRGPVFTVDMSIINRIHFIPSMVELFYPNMAKPIILTNLIENVEGSKNVLVISDNDYVDLNTELGSYLDNSKEWDSNDFDESYDDWSVKLTPTERGV